MNLQTWQRRKLLVERASMINFWWESAIILGLTLVLWIIRDVYQPKTADILPHLSVRSGLLYLTLLEIILVGVFYGTSFVVTPLRLVLFPFAPLISQAANFRSAFKRKSLKPRVDTERSSPPKLTSAEDVLSFICITADDQAVRMERRMNIYLIVGMVVAIMGLGVWYFRPFL